MADVKIYDAPLCEQCSPRIQGQVNQQRGGPTPADTAVSGARSRLRCCIRTSYEYTRYSYKYSTLLHTTCCAAPLNSNSNTRVIALEPLSTTQALRMHTKHDRRACSARSRRAPNYKLHVVTVFGCTSRVACASSSFRNHHNMDDSRMR